MHISRRFFLSITLVCLLCLSAFAALDTPQTGETVIVKSDKATLYKSASNSASATGTLEKFVPVKILEQSGAFSKVETNDQKTGYVKTSDLAGSRFASTSISGGRQVNVRKGATINTPVLFKVDNNYPVKILDKKNDRVLIVDYEGDKGWVHENLLKTERHVIVTPPEGLDWINCREGPGLDEDRKPIYPLRFTAQRGVILKVLEEKDGWIKIESADASDDDQAWCSANIVWGWYDK